MTNTAEEPTPTNGGGAIQVFFGNVQGTGSGVKLPHLAARTLDADIIVLNETNKKPGDEGCFKTLGIKFGRISNTPNPDRTGCGYGTFLATDKQDANLGDHIRVHSNFEIGVVFRNISGIKLSVIGMYRSPSMDDAECCEFYRELRTMIEECRSSDVILLGGDDNSHDHKKSYPKARRAFRELEAIRRDFCGVHIVNESTRGSNQTDHVVAFCDPLLFDISAIVCPGVGDHSEMHVKIKSKEVVLSKPLW